MNTPRLIIFALFILAAVLCYENREQQRTIDALIDLNHDKSVYIDAGCRGPYQGTEEMLPGEKP